MNNFKISKLTLSDQIKSNQGKEVPVGKDNLLLGDNCIVLNTLTIPIFVITSCKNAEIFK
jgi:hypothetical protein